MPKVKLGRADPGMELGKKMKSAIMESDENCMGTADKIGISNITLSYVHSNVAQPTYRAWYKVRRA